MTTRHIIKIAQLNMGRGAIVNDQLLHYCQTNNVDIALVQEPYTRRGLMVGLESAPLRTHLCPGVHRMNNVVHGSGIIVLNPNLKVLARDDLTTENITVMAVDIGGGKTLTLISAYFKFRIPTIVHTTALSNIIDHIVGDYVICVDANAFSQRWFSRITDARGEVVEDMIDRYHLHCHNRRSRSTTFSGARGNTNIDLTLSSPGFTQVEEWAVVVGETSSDHAIIAFELHLATLTKATKRPKRYAEHKADWEAFSIALAAALDTEEATLINGGIDEKAACITRCMQTAASKSIPTSRSKRKLRPPWWTDDLTEKRRILNTAARNRYEDRTNNVLNGIYRTARNNFTSQLKKEKRFTWRQHCTVEGKYVWGNLYKWLKKGTSPAKIPSSMKKPDGSYTSTLGDTASLIVNTLIPNDPQLYNEELEVEGCYEYEPCTQEELKKALWRTSLKKSPGVDNLTAGIARKSWPYIAGHLCNLANTCLRTGLFPSSWKSAHVTIIRKSADNDPTEIKSYRPISLLPILAKSLEKLICDRLINETKDNRSSHQHGFVKDKSTFTAIQALLDWHKSSPDKYTLAVFLDISGAFDNLDWTVLHQDLQLLGCSNSTKAITRSYLTKRKASINIGGETRTIGLTRGCPQGSLFGPVLWNVTMEQLLKTELPRHANIQAYADDIALSISGKSRKELQTRASEILQLILQWGNERKLSFSSAKSIAVPFKGNLVPGFTVGFGDNRIVTKQSARYLGIILDSKLTFKDHVATLRTKNQDIFTRMRGVFGSGWGMKRENASVLYKCVFIPRVLYGVQFWHQATTTHKEKVTLSVIQRKSLLGITSAYRTAATESLLVIAGVFPLDLEVSLQNAIIEARSLPEDRRDNHIDNKRKSLVAQWQTRWDSSTKGRWTHRLIPDINKRLNTPLWTNHYIVQFLTGHGDFRAKLHQFSLVEDPTCECGAANETPQHIIFDCSRLNEPRSRLELAVLRSGHLWPCEPETLLSSRALYAAFDRYAEEALELKKALR